MARHLSAVAALESGARTEFAVLADLLEDVRRAYADLPAESESKPLVAVLVSLTGRALSASRRRQAGRGGDPTAG